MTRADGIATHLLQQGELAAQRGAVDGSTQRPEVVMIAHALELTPLTIEEEPSVGHDIDAPDAEYRRVGIHEGVIAEDARDSLI